MTSEKRFKSEIGIFDAFHSGFVVPLAKFLDGEEEAEQAEIEDGYDDAILSIERAEAEGFYLGLKYAYVMLNGHDPIGDEDE